MDSDFNTDEIALFLHFSALHASPLVKVTTTQALRQYRVQVVLGQSL